MASVQSSISTSASLPDAQELSINNSAITGDIAANSTGPKKSDPAGATASSKSSSTVPIIDRFLNLISSIPFGIVLLILLITSCMIGMLIQQQELDTFPGYYAELTPSEKSVYGHLGFFNIYHVWYFNLLLLLLSLNIILASIDHFPAAWSFIAKKKLTASPTFAMAQRFREKAELPNLDRKQLTERTVKAARAMRFKVRVTEDETRTTVFAERGVWNRLGAYVVHIGLLTIFAGGFLTSRGYTGMMPIVPGESGNKVLKQDFNVDSATAQHAVNTVEIPLPFTVEGLDIQQKPIKKEGGVDAGNTLDWLTRVRFRDQRTGKETEALIHMNHPFDYKGFRFFQASLSQQSSARNINLRVATTGGETQQVTIKRNGETKLADGTRLRFDAFYPAAQVSREGKIELAGFEYQNPAAHLRYLLPNGEEGEVWAFNEAFLGQISNAPFLKQQLLDKAPFSVALTDFEKVSSAHHLSVQYDPGSTTVYVGFTILCLTLIAIFFFSHQRLWIVVEDGNVYAGGDANRNRLGFEDRAKKLLALIREPKAA